jgi:hypothetical protein
MYEGGGEDPQRKEINKTGSKSLPKAPPQKEKYFTQNFAAA